VFSIPTPRAGRTIDGISAVLLPYLKDGRADLETWATLVERTWAAGLTPAVNMDTGYANLLSAAERRELLTLTRQMAKGRRFVAGAFVEGEEGKPVDLYRREAVSITEAGGLPILFPSTGIQSLDRGGLVRLFREVGQAVPQFLGFELGEMFVSFGRIWELETFRAVLDIPQMVGAKHSSLSRAKEIERLSVRNIHRPEFRVYTGNDRAIDLVLWGSDYLLGLSAFHVEAFAQRDRFFATEDDRWRELNDWLQYLGMYAFRQPVPAYKHSCAQFLKLRNVIPEDEPHPRGLRRSNSDIPVLGEIAQALDQLLAARA